MKNYLPWLGMVQRPRYGSGCGWIRSIKKGLLPWLGMVQKPKYGSGCGWIRFIKKETLPWLGMVQKPKYGSGCGWIRSIKKGTLLFLLVVSFGVGFSPGTWANDAGKKTDEGDDIENEFRAEGCIGSAEAEEKCGWKEDKEFKSDKESQDKLAKLEKEQDLCSSTEDRAEYCSNLLNTFFKPEEGAKKNTGCWDAPEETTLCCSNPTTCLGGDSLATLEQVNNVVTVAGPGVASALTGFGQDMSGMCKTIQQLAGAGAGLAAAAATKCKASIASCNSSCDKELKKQCKLYELAKKNCQIGEDFCNLTPPAADSCKTTKAYPPFKKAETHAKNIIRAKKNKSTCRMQSAKATDWGSKMGQMLNSGLSAELCIRQASLTKDKKACEAAGWTWKDGECVEPEPDVRIAQCESAGGTWNTATQKCKPPASTPGPITVTDTTPTTSPPLGNPPSPDPEIAPMDTIINPDAEDGDSTESGGGGDTARNNKTKIGTPEESEDDPWDVSGGADGTGSASGLTGGQSGSLFGSSFGRGGRGYGRRRGKNRGDKDKNNYKMGGGGFSGYAGGGRGSDGDGDGDYAHLKLSKKQLDEIEKKQGAMRKTASEGFGGAHENIFERITRRFKALCQKDLDCR